MSIATELTLLANSKQAIKNSINQKGGSITDSTPFADYSTAIDNLPSGGSGNPLLTSIEVDDFTGTTFNQATSYITDITIPSGVTTIGNSAFAQCRTITSITLPSGVTSLGYNAFDGCIGLTVLDIPSGVTSIGQNCFNSCTTLLHLSFSSSLTSIGARAFYGSTRLQYLVFNSTTPPTLANSNAFTNTNNCPIYVPAESVDAYKAANNWSTYASRIFAIEQVATVDGNPVYNYDLGNTDSTTITSAEMLNMPTGTSIEFVEGITNMGGSISGYTTVTLPSTFTTFNDQNMIGSSVTTLTMKSTTPPTAERNKFGGSGLTAIYVPASAVDTYKADSGWSSFASIIQAIPTE